MSGGMSDGVDAGIPSIHDMLAAATARLRATGVRDEGLGQERPARRVLGFPVRASIKPAGRVWRLGVLLLSADGELYATGDTLRASTEVRRGYTAESARLRAQRSAAARRGGFAEGESVNVGWTVIDVDAVAVGAGAGAVAGGAGEGGAGAGAGAGEIVRLHGGVPQVRWNLRDQAAWVELASYLDDRIRLLEEASGGN